MLAIIAFIAYAAQYTQKINMSVAIVCMINNTALKEIEHAKQAALLDFNSTGHDHDLSHYADDSHSNTSSVDDKCKFSSVGKKKAADGPFTWDKQIQGIALAAYFVGYLVTEIPGGYLSLRFGAKIVLALSMLIGSLFTVLIPVSARFHWIALVVCRLIVGAAHGAIWPAFSGFWANWAPPAERSKLIGISNAGSQIGNVIALPLSSFLCMNGFDGGWPSIFYVFGGFGFVWFIMWMVLAADSPTTHRFIRDKEREYIEEETREIIESHKAGETSAPWGKIMTSKSCIAIFIGHTCSNWGTYLYLTSLPLYMKEVLRFDIKSSGGMAALPYIVFWFFIVMSGVVGDLFMQKLKIRKTVVRKIFNGLGFFFPMAAVIGLSFVTCAVPYAGVALLTVGLAFTGCCYGAGFLVNYNDVAGPYSGIVFGIGNTFATIPGIAAPYLVGIITKNGTQAQWRIVFIITAIIYLIGGIVLLIFTRGDPEKWAKHEKNEEQMEEEMQLKTTRA